MRRFWHLIDRALRKVGLERISQQPIKEFQVRLSDHGPRHVRIVFRNGYLFSGYLDSRFSGILKYGDSDVVPR